MCFMNKWDLVSCLPLASPVASLFHSLSPQYLSSSFSFFHSLSPQYLASSLSHLLSLSPPRSLFPLSPPLSFFPPSPPLSLSLLCLFLSFCPHTLPSLSSSLPPLSLYLLCLLSLSISRS